ncbi:MAG: hypothetical protein ABI462_01195 [Ignavibacteria bacterium]
MKTKLRYFTSLKTTAMIFFACLVFSNASALNWFQKTSINNDRSGKLKLTYWTASSELKNVDTYKSLPFTEDKIRSFFSSENNTIESVSIGKNNPDTTYINIFINFKDIQKINSAAGFSRIKVTWYKNSDSTVFLYQLNKDEQLSDDISASYTFILPTNAVIRTAGAKTNDSTVSMGLKPDTFKNGTTLFAVFKNVNTNSGPVSSQSDSTKKQNEGAGSEDPRKKCGPFGFELPLIFAFGLFLMRSKLLR